LVVSKKPKKWLKYWAYRLLTTMTTNILLKKENILFKEEHSDL